MPPNRRQFLAWGTGLMVGLALPAWARLQSQDPVREFRLVARPARIDLGQGPSFKAYTYNGQVPGPELRLREGEILRVVLENHLPEPTTIHWHGVPVPNPMDGVPGVTQEAVPPGGKFVYQFTAAPAGTFLYHSHVGYQLDQGLYGALIIEPRQDSGAYDREYTLLLEDWVTADGGGVAPVARRQPMGMMGGGMMGRGGMGGGPAGPGRQPLLEPYYQAYAVNGKVFAAQEPLLVRQGERVRLRIGNPSAATIYHLRLAGHPLTIVASDANPVRPLPVDVLRIGMGERYDVEFVADNPGRWLLAAWNSGLGEDGLRVPVLYEEAGAGDWVAPQFSPGLRVNDPFRLVAGRPWRVDGAEGPRYNQVLSGGMMGSSWWSINGSYWPDAPSLPVEEGRRVRLAYFNRSMMPHPMHLHGHFFRVVNPGLDPSLWPAKDTVIVDPMQGLEVEFLADNPGVWFHHCHNLYHMEAGMANTLHYAGSAHKEAT